MAVDQTIGSFDPVHNESFAFGLGWDSVSQPGLAAVGFDGWAKGGDSIDYGAALVVSPQAQLGIVVLTVSGGGSARAIAVAERVLLRALAENGRIAAFPSPLPPVVPPVAPVPDGLLAAIAGEYAQGSLIVQLQRSARRLAAGLVALRRRLDAVRITAEVPRVTDGSRATRIP